MYFSLETKAKKHATSKNTPYDQEYKNTVDYMCTAMEKWFNCSVVHC